MGYALHYLMVEHLDAEEVAARLGASLGDEDPDAFDNIVDGAPVSVGTLASGWTLVLDPPMDLPTDAVLGRLSEGTRVASVAVEEHTMFAMASLWADGAEVWQVMKDPNRAAPPLQVRGTAPQDLDARIEAALGALRDDPGVDHLFEVPVRLVTDLTGWEYAGGGGEDPVMRPIVGDMEPGLLASAPVPPPARRGWRSAFGRR